MANRSPPSSSAAAPAPGSGRSAAPSYPKQFAPPPRRAEPVPGLGAPLPRPGFRRARSWSPATNSASSSPSSSPASGATRRVLIEPEGRNTAPAILAAALMLRRRAPDALMLVCPSDHVIPDAAAFRPRSRAARRRPRRAGSSPSASRPTGPRPAMASSSSRRAADRAAPGAAAARALRRKARRRDRRRRCSPTGGTCGTAASSCFGRRRSSRPSRRTPPAMLAAVRAAIAEATRRPRLPAARARRPGPRPRAISIDYAVMEKAGEPRRSCRSTAAGPISAPGTRSRARWGRTRAGVAPSGAVTAIDCERHAAALREPGPGAGRHRAEERRRDRHARRGAGRRHRPTASDVKAAVAALKAEGAPQADRVPALPPALGLVRDAVARRPASRSSGSWCAPGGILLACRAMSTAPSTGWWSRAPRGSPSATRSGS